MFLLIGLLIPVLRGLRKEEYFELYEEANPRGATGKHFEFRCNL